MLLHRVLLIYSMLIDTLSCFNLTMLKFYYFGKKSNCESFNFTLLDTAQVQRISIETFLKQFKVYQKVLTIFIQLCEKYLKIRPLKQRFYLISYPYTANSIGILHWKYENMLLLFTLKIGQWAIWIRVIYKLSSYK